MVHAQAPAGAALPADLNAPQREAVLYLGGPCLVLAGAGSGKTRVITQKIAYLLRDCGYGARQVVALTFTNKAAREMGERVRGLVDPRLSKGLTISTFHSLGLRLLREECRHAGLKPGFSILDAHDTLAIIQDLLATTDRNRLRGVQQAISLWKNALMDADAADRAARSPSEIEAARVYRSYCATLAAYQAVDFDDLIAMPADLLQNNDAVRERWQSRVHYLLVDEYQDTNLCQYALLRALVGTRSLFTAVGDDDQAIYAWRGATVENLKRLTEDWPDLRVIKLEQNYRSAQRILSAANRVIQRNPNLYPKSLWSDLGVGEAIQVTAMDNDLAEAEAVAIGLSAGRFERRCRWSDFAVLYRSNQQARVLEQALRNLRIPYTISGGQSFFDKVEIRDVMAYLRLVANEDDDPALIRAVTTPRRGIGQTTLQLLGEIAAARQISLFGAMEQSQGEERIGTRQREALDLFTAFVRRMRARAAGRGVCAGDVLAELLDAIQYERYLYDTLDERVARGRWQNVLELTEWLGNKAREDGLSLLELVQHVALVTLLERNDDQEPDAVKLSTLHAAKGLEFRHVRMIGVEEGLLPHMGREEQDADPEVLAKQDVARIQEERRLMYVGITRAQRSLHLSWCRKRRKGGQDVVREPSRFIAEMGLEESDAEQDSAQENLTPAQRLQMLRNLLAGKP